MLIRFIIFFFLGFLIISCNDNSGEKIENEIKTDSLSVKKTDTISINKICINDSLNQLANLIAGNKSNDSSVLANFFRNKTFVKHNASFQQKWENFQKTRLQNLISFQQNEITKEMDSTSVLFYPFSGPDILHAQTFFPNANHFVLMGLEPIGTLPVFEHKEDIPDSMSNYYGKINKSLHAILNFSFFRTNSMSEDLKNEDIDGTLHLLLLFINRNGNTLCDVKPFVLDSIGNIVYQKSFSELKSKTSKAKGVEIAFNRPDKKAKKLHYFSLDLSNAAYDKNTAVQKYLNHFSNVTTYLKGASYLMHNAGFSSVRNYILSNSKQVMQDDSGIAFRYFEKNKNWKYIFYGEYKKPISLFANRFQVDLDSMYKIATPKKLGFGLGYNFKDNNSNLMIAIKIK